jgi:hypothetical protein
VCGVVSLVEVGVLLGEVGKEVVGGVVVAEVPVDRSAVPGACVGERQDGRRRPAYLLSRFGPIWSTSADPLPSHSWRK